MGQQQMELRELAKKNNNTKARASIVNWGI
jgi:hypothetical protein